MEMGVIPGLIVKIERYAPLGEPIEISIGDCHLSLRKTEAKLICIEDESTSIE
jgi:ferrous iron transport protein A